MMIAMKKKVQSAISNFLGDNTDDDEEEIVKPVVATTDTDDDTQEPSTQFSALSNDLFKLGVFTTEDGEDEAPISTPEEFLERFNAEKKKGASENCRKTL